MIFFLRHVPGFFIKDLAAPGSCGGKIIFFVIKIISSPIYNTIRPFYYSKFFFNR